MKFTNQMIGSRNKISLLEDFIMENKIGILCLKEAEILENYNIDVYRSRGYEIETEKTMLGQTKRTSMYIRSVIKYQRKHEFEQPESYTITITLEDAGIGIATLYQTYKLTHKPTHKQALVEQISILINFM
jgi:hypothetical protein